MFVVSCSVLVEYAFMTEAAYSLYVSFAYSMLRLYALHYHGRRPCI